MTDKPTPERFFADLLLPLHRANHRRGVHYFATGKDAAANSYWQTPLSRTGGVTKLGAASGDSEALIAALGDYWTEQGEAMLTRLLPDLEALCRELFEPEAQDGTPQKLSISVYPLF